MSIVIKRIDEADFGCEGAPDNKPICDRVTFEADNETIVLEIPQSLLWQSKVDEGMEITEDVFRFLNQGK